MYRISRKHIQKSKTYYRDKNKPDLYAGFTALSDTYIKKNRPPLEDGKYVLKATREGKLDNILDDFVVWSKYAYEIDGHNFFFSYVPRFDKCGILDRNIIVFESMIPFEIITPITYKPRSRLLR